ncbi:MAG: hypothetical protein IT581_15645 [Verrucomicrobiales bacterium]|nr:hypothetical protein [Verrucomicrobiales bacterium]
MTKRRKSTSQNRCVVLYETFRTGMIDGWREWITLEKSGKKTASLTAEKLGADGEGGVIARAAGIRTWNELEAAWEECHSELMTQSGDLIDLVDLVEDIQKVMPDLKPPAYDDEDPEQ